MWEDLQRGRRTEIDYLQGVITAIADRHGLAGAAVAPHRGADQERGSRRQGFARADAGADPALRRYAGGHQDEADLRGPCDGSGTAGGAAMVHAAPPTVTPSPGYDAQAAGEPCRADRGRAGCARDQAGFAAPHQAQPRRHALKRGRMSPAYPQRARHRRARWLLELCRHRRGGGLCRRDQRLSTRARPACGEARQPSRRGRAPAGAGDGRERHRQPQRRRRIPLRVARLRKAIAAENIGAGFPTFSDMLKQWEASTGHRENLLIPGARRVGVAFVDNPKSPYRKFWAMVITN